MERSCIKIWRPGEIIKAWMSDISSSGEGVGREITVGEGSCGEKGVVVFVPYTIPGEIVNARITSCKSNYLRAELVELLQSSPDRIDPLCVYFGKCPGCSLQHISYAAQCRIKRSRAAGIFSRFNDIDGPPDFIPSEAEYGYRTHLSISCEAVKGKVNIGFVDPVSRGVLDIESCPLMPDWANNCYREIRSLINKRAGTDFERFQFRMVLDYESRNVIVVASRNPHKRHRGDSKQLKIMLKDFMLNKTIKRALLGIEYQIHPASFIQANHYTADIIYKEALKRAKACPDDIVCDLYSGNGFFTLALARESKEVISIEEDQRACENISKSARKIIESAGKAKAREPDIKIFQGKVEDTAKSVFKEFNPSLIIANPPRSGIHKRAINEIIASGSIRRIVMISCDIASCARDTSILVKHGFLPERPLIIDCYPQTAQMEVVIALEKATAKHQRDNIVE